MTLEDYQAHLNRKMPERDVLVEQFNRKKFLIDSNKTNVELLIKARYVLSEVSRLTQKKVSEHIESLVTMVLQSVYNRPLYFLAEFDIKRNKPECQMTIYEGDQLTREEMLDKSFIPKDEEGGGILDVVSFALRVVLWTIQNPQARNFFLLDEPGKFLGQLVENFGRMLKEVSNKLNLQLLIITHDNTLKEIADKTWTVTLNNKISYVTED